MEVFQDYAYYYNAFYQDKDYKGEAAQIDLLLKKYGENVKSVISFGCGTGRHECELYNMGYQCSGIDMSELMIEIARKHVYEEGKNIDFFVSDIREHKSQVKFDAVISLFHVMSYQIGNRDILDAFSAAKNCLRRGGLFLFDVWYGPGVLSDKPAVRVREIDNEENKLVRIARPVMHDKENMVDVCYEVLVINQKTNIVKKIEETHHMRYFFRPELEYFLQQAGFELICNLDCNTLEETDYGSWTSYFIARAV